MTETLDPFGLKPLVAAGELRSLRQSTMGTADVCLRRVGFELDPAVAGGTSEARICGTAYHAGLEAHYNGGATSPLVAARETFDAISEGFDRWEQGSRQEALERVMSMIRRYFEDGCQWDLSHQVIGVEQEWYAPLNEGLCLRGTIDLVLRAPGGGIILVDHKTAGRKWQKGKESARKNNQATLYLWAWWRLTGELGRFSFDVMTYAGDFERRVVTRESNEFTGMLQKAISLANLLDICPVEMLPPNTTSPLCSEKFCDFWAVCPWGQALETFDVSMTGASV